MTHTLLDNPNFTGIRRRTPDGRHVVAVSLRSYMSVPEIRAALAELLGDQAGEIDFAVLHAGEEVTADAVSDTTLLTGNFHAMHAPGSVVETELAERITLMMTEDAVVSMSDSIGDLGGDSLMCLELSEALISMWGVEIDPVEIFRMNSLKELADDIEARR
ncbi:acyl carrier protein [Streptomyces sp. NPDC046374]|uniref:acyl carrier protein n=1 Tax=Streptomyces sp. NPDC046374 TaxID=3154917 RepID=UPI0033EB58B8